MGKMAWPKGLSELFSLMKYVKRRLIFPIQKSVVTLFKHFCAKRTNKCFSIDMFGNGHHINEIKEHAISNNLPVSEDMKLFNLLINIWDDFNPGELSWTERSFVVEGL